MKRFLLLAAMTAALALSACQTAPVTSSTTTAAPSTSASIGKALQEVTLARQASTQLAMAKTITWADDDKVQASLTLIRNTLTSAQTALPTNPAQAAQLLADALNALAAYQQGVPK